MGRGEEGERGEGGVKTVTLRKWNLLDPEIQHINYVASCIKIKLKKKKREKEKKKKKKWGWGGGKEGWLKMLIPKAWIFCDSECSIPLSHAASTITTTTNKQKQNNYFFKGGGWGFGGLRGWGGGKEG